MKPTFSAHIVTPSQSTRIDNITFFRARDRSGVFGILARHTELLTILEPSVAIAVIDGKEEYFAFNGGILSFRKGVLTVTTKEFVQSRELEALREIISRDFKERQQKESLFHTNMANLEKAFFRKIIELERDLG